MTIDEEMMVREFYIKKSTEMKRLRLSEEQIKLFNILSKVDYMTTSQLAKLWKVSTQCANGKLTVLYKKGYAERVKYFAESGGIEYEYCTAINV